MRLGPFEFSYRKKALTDEQILDMLGGGIPTVTGIAVSADTALRVPAVAAAVRTIADKRAAGEIGMGDGFFGTGVGETSILERIEELKREDEALAETERRINAVVSAREAENRAISDRPLLEDRATRFRPEDAYALPNTAPAPTRREDPYFDGPSSLSSAERTGADMATGFIKQFEGFRTKAYWDVNAYRVGYGSDTKTNADGSVERVTAATTVSLEEANRDLARRIADFQAGIQSMIGKDTWASFSEEQQAALTSIAYNYGELPQRIADAIAAGNPGQIGEAIRDLGDDNGGINRKRRAEEADLFFSGSGSGPTPGMIAIDDEREAVEKLQEAYDQLGAIGTQALQGLAAALADGKLEGREVLQVVMQLIQQILNMPEVQKGIGNLLGSLFGGLFGGGGGDPWAGLRFANGTNYAPGGPSMVNERGGEIIDLPRGSRVIPHDVSMSMAKQQPTINFQSIVNNNSSSRVETREEDDGAGGRKIIHTLSDQMVEAMNTRGTSLYGEMNRRVRPPPVRR